MMMDKCPERFFCSKILSILDRDMVVASQYFRAIEETCTSCAARKADGKKDSVHCSPGTEA